MQNDELSMSAQVLETERAKFVDFFNLAPIGYFILDDVGLVIEANQVGVQLLSVSKGALLNQRFQSFIAPEDFEKFYAFLHRMKPKESKQGVEIKVQLANGSFVYTKMEGIAIQNAFTNLLSYYITLTDITANKLAQQKLQVTTERLEMSLSASGTGTWSIDLTENRIFLDNFSLSLLELHSWEFDGRIKKFLDLVHPEDQSLVKRNLLNDNQFDKIDLEFRVLTKSGLLKYIATKGHRVQTPMSKTFSIGTLLDITERKNIALARQELQDEKQKLILATTFKAQENERYKISSALHDSICQLLYGIRLNLQNMQFIAKSKQELEMVQRLIDQAIKETRELSYELTPSVLRDFGFVEGVREMTQRLSSKHFQITAKLKETANKLSSDLQLSIFRMMQELLNNCIKHSNATKAEIILCTENGIITIVVIDNGNGFKGDIETLIAKGSGLRGIKNRILLLNGNLDLHSSSEGTKITITFNHQTE
jgi:PAS domain S-box-containing protein